MSKILKISPRSLLRIFHLLCIEFLQSITMNQV